MKPFCGKLLAVNSTGSDGAAVVLYLLYLILVVFLPERRFAVGFAARFSQGLYALLGGFEVAHVQLQRAAPVVFVHLVGVEQVHVFGHFGSQAAEGKSDRVVDH